MKREEHKASKKVKELLFLIEKEFLEKDTTIEKQGKEIRRLREILIRKANT